MWIFNDFRICQGDFRIRYFQNIASTRYVDDKQITDHYAIIPTGQGLSALNSMNPISVKVYEVIARRFLSIFYPPAQYQKVGIKISMPIKEEENVYSEQFLRISRY